MLAEALAIHIVVVGNHVGEVESNEAEDGCRCADADGLGLQNTGEKVAADYRAHVQSQHVPRPNSILDATSYQELQRQVSADVRKIAMEESRSDKPPDLIILQYLFVVLRTHYVK